MSTATATRPPASSPPPLHRITVDEYERIIEAGALEDPSRVELIDGYMVDKMGKNAAHRYTTKETLKALESRLPAGWTSQKEEPVRIPPYDEPEPDVAIVRGTDADYEFRLPTAADVALLVEVSETTLSQDRGKKLPAYAKATDPRLLDHQPGRPPGRGLLPAGEDRLPVSPDLRVRRASPGHDRRPGAPSDPRR